MENVPINDLTELLQQQQTYKYTSMVLQQKYPGERGFSEMNVCLFHRSKGITTKAANNEVASIVFDPVEKVVIHLFFCKPILTLFSLGF